MPISHDEIGLYGLYIHDPSTDTLDSIDTIQNVLLLAEITQFH